MKRGEHRVGRATQFVCSIGLVAAVVTPILGPAQTRSAPIPHPRAQTKEVPDSSPPSPRGVGRITPSGLELPPGRLWDAAEDQLGYVWFASEAGLTFDGGAAKALTVNTESANQPDVRATTSVRAAADGVFYADGTLKHLDPWSNELTDTGIVADTIVDGPGRAKWVVSGLEQIRLVDGRDGSILTETTIELDHAGRRTNAAASTDDGTLYVGGGSTIAEVTPNGTKRQLVVTSEVAAVTKGSGDSVLFSTPSGLWTIGPTMPRPHLLFELPGPSRGVPPTTALAQLADGTVLVGLGGGGLGVYDPASARWVDDGAKPLTDSVIDLIFEQANGTVWLATDRGELLQYHDTTDFDTIALPTDRIPLSLAQVDGALWAALGPDGAARYDLETRSWTRPVSFDDTSDSRNEDPNVTSIADFQDATWFGTANQGLLWVTGRGTRAELVQGLANRTGDLQVDQDRLFAISSQHTELKSFDGEGRLGWELNWVTPQNRGNAAIIAVSNGLAYVVSHGGVGIFDTTKPTDTPIKRFDDLDWTPWANAIYVHDDEIVWIGTEVGLMRLDLTSGVTARFSTHDGLPSDTITALVANAERDALWVGTNAGLGLIDLKTDKVLSSFGSADGLPTEAIRPVRAVQGADGTGYLLTAEGVAVIPAKVPERSHDRLSFAVRCRSGCGDRPSLDLVRNPDRLTVDLVSPQGTRARLMPIEYRLDAPDHDWELLPAGARTVSFGSLAPGRHRLEVRAANIDPDESTAQDWTVFTVVVDQIWWRRASVQSMIVLAGLVAAALAIAWRDAQRRAHALELEETIAERTRELEHSRADAERANQAKNRFLMTVSHDLRSPLAGIVGFTELISGTELDERQRRYNDGVARSAKHLAELVEDLLYQSANATLATDEPRGAEPTLLETVMNEAVDFVSAGATANDITVAVHCEGCDTPVLVDARGLKYVLGNLLTNAINYSGGTKVDLSAIHGGDGRYAFSLVDDGGSLDPENVARVFEPGFRAASVDVSGTGLGLSICEDWVAAHGSEITVEVQPKVFTEFRFSLELEGVADTALAIAPGTPKGAEATSRPRHSVGDEPRVVMVVEDDEIVRDVLVTMLDGIGCDVSAFSSAEVALDSLAGRKWDLIFTDVMMQPTNGIEFARAVRAQMGQASPPVAAITGVPQEASHAEVFDAIVNKPVVAQDLLRVIDRF